MNSLRGVGRKASPIDDMIDVCDEEMCTNVPQKMLTTIVLTQYLIHNSKTTYLVIRA